MVPAWRPRLFGQLLEEHLARHRQMALVAGPRQVGKTTLCRQLATAYLDWDNADDRKEILTGPGAVAARLGLERLHAELPVVAFDELHKMGRWKGFLKGFFDTYGDRVRILVTGSSRLDVYRRGGDSLMGRYLLYRLHPFSVAELGRPRPPEGDNPICAPICIAAEDFEALWEHGGYPEPFVKRDVRFSRRWRALRHHQLVREDLRDLTRVQELAQLEHLVLLLAERSGQQLIYSSLAREVGVAVDTTRRWLDVLCSLHTGFLVRPWHRNLARALRKEPKWFLRDWSTLEDSGQRAETFVACHLLKAVEGWEDLGLGRFELRYLRDREKREVDFLVVRDRQPWFLVEVKLSESRLAPALGYFQAATGARHAFQVVLDLPFEEASCFTRAQPVVVPARTFLSQLL